MTKREIELWAERTFPVPENIVNHIASEVARYRTRWSVVRLHLGDEEKTEYTPSGMRKKSNNEYVTKRYARQCRGLGLYYQHAHLDITFLAIDTRTENWVAS